MKKKNYLHLLCFFVVATGQFSAATAQVYKWVDEKGVVQFGDKPPVGRKVQMIEAPHESALPQAKEETAVQRASIQEQEIEFNKRRILREQNECAALARDIVDSETPIDRANLMDKFKAKCPNRGFECTTVKSDPKKNKCEPAQFNDGKTIVRNTWKAQ